MIELIESIESTPDTVLTLRNGKLYIVTEPPETIVDMTIAYKQLLFSGLSAPVVKRNEEEAESKREGDTPE